MDLPTGPGIVVPRCLQHSTNQLSHVIEHAPQEGELPPSESVCHGGRDFPRSTTIDCDRLDDRLPGPELLPELSRGSPNAHIPKGNSIRNGQSGPHTRHGAAFRVQVEYAPFFAKNIMIATRPGGMRASD